MNPTTELPSGVTESVDETVARAKAMVAPTVSANQVSAGIQEVAVPEPEVAPEPDMSVAGAVAEQTGGIIEAKTAEAADLQRLRQEQQAFLGDENLGDVFTGTSEDFLGQTMGGALGELKDIQLQLAGIDEQSELSKTRIEGAAGQTLGQSQREVTQEDRENAVRRSGLAARAAILQGNIETATTLANQAVDLLYKDRTLRNQNLNNQITSLQNVVDDQTSQLLEQERRTYEEDQASIEEVKNAVNTALTSGAATSADISQLTDPSLDDATRLSLAQSIVSRGATEDRDLDIAQQRAAIRASGASAALNEQKLAQAAEEVDKTGISPVTGKPFTVDQSNSGTFSVRMEAAMEDMDSVEELFSPTLGEYLPNKLKSDERKRVEQAETNFITAVLRKESGAAIGQDEKDEARKVYIPRSGDDEEVLAQKRQARVAALQGMINASGGAYEQLLESIPEEEPPAPTNGVTSTGIKYTIE